MDRDFFSLTVFGGNLLAGDVHSSVTLDRHVQPCQWTGSISLLISGLLWASAPSLEAWRDSPVFLLLIPCYPVQTSFHVRTVNPSKGREQSVLRWLINRIEFFEISLRPHLYLGPSTTYFTQNLHLNKIFDFILFLYSFYFLLYFDT